MHGVNPPSHITEMRKKAKANIANITEKMYENSGRENKQRTLKIKTDIIASVRIGMVLQSIFGIICIITFFFHRTTLFFNVT